MVTVGIIRKQNLAKDIKDTQGSSNEPLDRTVMSSDEDQDEDDEDEDEDVVKADHQSLNTQVNQYFQNINQYTNEVDGVTGVEPFGDVDLASLNNEELQIDPSMEDKVNEHITAAAAALAAYEQQAGTDKQKVVQGTSTINNKTTKTQIERSKNNHDKDSNNINDNNNSTKEIDPEIYKANEKGKQNINTNIESSHINFGDPYHETQITQKVMPSSNSNNKDKRDKQTPDLNQNKLSRSNIEENIPNVTNNIPGIEPGTLLPIPEGVDPKKMCRFCGKTFAHPGSLGRHLDNRKGSHLHPLDAIEKLRANVARRGDPEAVKARRVMRSKEYNRRDYVKEKNRLRRKFNSKMSRIRESAQMKFYRRLNQPILPSHPSFPRMVLFFLPPTSWPHDPPTFQTLQTLITWLINNPEIQTKLPLLSTPNTIENYEEKLQIAYDNWQTLSAEAKKDTWIREQRICAQQALGNLTLFDFAVREKWAKQLSLEKKFQILKEKKANDMKGDVDGDGGVDIDVETAAAAAASGLQENFEHFYNTNAEEDYNNSRHQDVNVPEEMLTNDDRDDDDGDDDDDDNDDDDDDDDDDDVEVEESQMAEVSKDSVVKLEEAELAAVAAAAAAAVKENYDT